MVYYESSCDRRLNFKVDPASCYCHCQLCLHPYDQPPHPPSNCNLCFPRIRNGGIDGTRAIHFSTLGCAPRAASEKVCSVSTELYDYRNATGNPDMMDSRKSGSDSSPLVYDPNQPSLYSHNAKSVKRLASEGFVDEYTTCSSASQNSSRCPPPYIIIDDRGLPSFKPDGRLEVGVKSLNHRLYGESSLKVGRLDWLPVKQNKRPESWTTFEAIPLGTLKFLPTDQANNLINELKSGNSIARA